MKNIEIHTENLSQYSRLFDLISDKKAGINGAVHLNFKDGIISFRGPNSFFKTHLQTDGEESDIEGIYVLEGEKFFAMIQRFKKVTFDGTNFLADEGHKLHLNILEGPKEYPVYEEGNDFIEVPCEFDSLQPQLRQIRGLLNESSDSHVFFHKDELLAYHENSLVRLKNYFTVEEDFSLPLEFFKVLERIQSSFSDSPILKIYKKEDSLLVHYHDEGEDGWNSLHYSIDSNAAFPVDPDDADFIESYNNKNFFSTSAYDLEMCLSFLEPFASGVFNDTVYISLQAKNRKLLFYFNDGSNSVEYHVPIKTLSDEDYYEQEKLNISFKKLKQTVRTISHHLDLLTLTITIRYDVDKPAVTFSTSSNPDDIFVRTTVE